MQILKPTARHTAWIAAHRSYGHCSAHPQRRHWSGCGGIRMVVSQGAGHPDWLGRLAGCFSTLWQFQRNPKPGHFRIAGPPKNQFSVPDFFSRLPPHRIWPRVWRSISAFARTMRNAVKHLAGGPGTAPSG